MEGHEVHTCKISNPLDKYCARSILVQKLYVKIQIFDFQYDIVLFISMYRFLIRYLANISIIP